MKETPAKVHSWEQQPGESIRAYTCFSVYRDIPPKSRSLREAYRQETGKTKAKGAPGGWTKWSTDFHWLERAQNYDGYLLELGRQEKVHVYVEELEGYRKRLRQLSIATTTIATMMLSTASKRLKEMKEEDVQRDLPPQALPNWVKAAASIANSATLSEGEALSVGDVITHLEQNENERTSADRFED